MACDRDCVPVFIVFAPIVEIVAAGDVPVVDLSPAIGFRCSSSQATRTRLSSAPRLQSVITGDRV
jgi:hypothetical protein